MNTVTVRNITIGEGRPKICVPIVGKTREEILNEAATFITLHSEHLRKAEKKKFLRNNMHS